MALVQNMKNHVLDLTGGGSLAPGDVANVDTTAPHEADLLDIGALRITDPTVDPPAPTTKIVPVVTTIAYSDPARQVSLDIDGETTDAELAAAIAAIGGRFRGAYASLSNGTAVKANDVVTNPSGSLVSRIADGTISGSYNSANWTALAGSSGLTPTAVKTTNYTAVSGDLVRVDTTSGSRTITLPAAAAGATVGVKVVTLGVGNSVTIAAAGSDVFNKTGGPTSLTLTMLNQGVVLVAISGVWVVQADDLALTQLDSRYPGARGKGYSVPKGSLDIWKAARDNSAAVLCEAVAFGDSITRGEGAVAGIYSYLQRIRERAIAAGYLDGGRGYNETDINGGTDLFGTEPNPVFAHTGFAVAKTYGAGYQSQATNDTITFKVKSSRARLWWWRYLLAGRFSYTVNGGAPVTVLAGISDAPQRAVGQFGEGAEIILLGPSDGMNGGGATNTIVVTNLGGNPTAAPVLAVGGFNAGQGSGSGNVPAGTYDYVITKSVGGGETVASNTVTVTVGSGGQRVDLYTSGNISGTLNIYRRVTGSGNPFSLATTVNHTDVNTNGPNSDNSATTDTAVHPPGVSTAGLDPANNYVNVNIEAINDTGIVFHNHGVSGADTSSFFASIDNFNNQVPVWFLSLQWGIGTNGITAGTASDLLRAAANSGVTAPMDPAKGRKPKLVMLGYGTNDQKIDRPFDRPNAPTVATGGVGNIPAGTYYYRVARVLSGGLGRKSVVSAGVTVNGSQQVIVTAPSGSFTGGLPPVFAVFRGTSNGNGNSAFVGYIIGYGSGAILLDNVVTPGANVFVDDAAGSGWVVNGPIDTSLVTENLFLAVRLARNAGADPMILIPAIDNLVRGLDPIKGAFLQVAEATSCPWVDLDVVYGPNADRIAAGYQVVTTDPHLRKAAYQAAGDFIWDNVLSK